MNQISISKNKSIDKVRAFFDLTKFRLSITVVFSSLFGYALAAQDFSIIKLIVFAVAGYATTASANVINQLIEINWLIT